MKQNKLGRAEKSADVFINRLKKSGCAEHYIEFARQDFLAGFKAGINCSCKAVKDALPDCNPYYLDAIKAIRKRAKE